MEESHSEISSDRDYALEAEKARALEVANLRLHNDELMEMLKWNAAIVAVLLEQAGGVAEVEREDLERIDLSKVNATVEYNQEKDIYVIKGVYDDDEV